MGIAPLPVHLRNEMKQLNLAVLLDLVARINYEQINRKHGQAMNDAEIKFLYSMSINLCKHSIPQSKTKWIRG